MRAFTSFGKTNASFAALGKVVVLVAVVVGGGVGVILPAGMGTDAFSPFFETEVTSYG